MFVVYHDLISLSVASDLYGKLTYDDLDCQKKIICEFMDEPEMFGQLGIKKTTSLGNFHQNSVSQIQVVPFQAAGQAR